MLLQTFSDKKAVFILGGGPSFTKDIADQLTGKPSIVLNSTARIAPSATALYFADWGWFRDNRPITDNFRGMVLTSNRRAWQHGKRRMLLIGPPDISAVPATSGHHAVDIAAAMGAKRIVLVGFDCRTVNGRSHHHDDYRVQHDDRIYRDKIRPLWRGWGARMRARGIEVMNATPGSAIMEFPLVDLGAVL